MIDKLLLATGNKGKFAEITELVKPLGVQTLSLNELDSIEEPEETEETFAGNSLLKAKYYGDAFGLPALADDSGLCVEALNGAPGIYSKRWADERGGFYEAMGKIEQEIISLKSNNLNAYFVCNVCIYNPQNKFSKSFEGRIDGTLDFSKKSRGGFGYNPIFKPHGYEPTFHEMTLEERNKISHRSQAFKQLLEWTQSEKM